ncbi:MAG: 1,4-alpha-glucan branching protein GlgB [gamma proteobacterium symbiont of Lucinoma myriamae]|nr:1,4-alpha-glucan branching protein GlgB [gamma proteobacterium symbiont of Lucinoma myriamae]MCU7818253.1 1,4-alpha-glucan branching protein GlgB [gamma proteobacterium symbiont of Lucinoma myriamae]MCU7832083.1 1,4-alpha-glucan branching protein GlgB [gamma proteobacterium symbiont of Lucinoma myriamae]
MKYKKSPIYNDLSRIIDAKHHDPFSVLGFDEANGLVRLFMPYTESVFVITSNKTKEPVERLPDSDFFEWQGDIKSLGDHYQLNWIDKSGYEHNNYDPYTFGAQISDFDLHLFTEGKLLKCYNVLGSHAVEVDGITGTLFATWAPNAERVSVIGDFNQWDGRCHPMRIRGGSGVWELFIPGVDPGSLYKYEILNRQSGQVLEKIDPYSQQYEYRPATASITADTTQYQWQDQDWLATREEDTWQHSPLSVYELHLGSWQRDEHNKFLNYRELAHRLVDYIKPLGFTHIELLPITEHPFDGSWGYQATGYFAPSSRFGSIDDFKYFVDYCHQNNIGILVDWVPAHFPKDTHGLAKFDGSALYEHEDPRLGEHQDWGTLIYNLGRNEVKNFLFSSAIFWLDAFHIDGLRVDAVASMLYLDYSREDDQWLPNKYGGNENLEAIDFIKELNHLTHVEYPGTVIIAEESTSWPQVTRPSWLGGLGFTMKWNMGWMHDILSFMQMDPIHRHYHHDKLTFGLLYSFSENFLLPFSHDEVVHGKGSMLGKMPGDEWQKFANLRLLYTFMFTYPGKKLLFMGCEFAQRSEWNFDKALEWQELESASHRGVKDLISQLNKLYTQVPALHYYDFDAQGFDWVDCHDSAQSILIYQRNGPDDSVIIILNFTPVVRENYRIGVPFGGHYEELFNSDSSYYNGSNIGNDDPIISEATPWMDREHSISITLPPLAGLILKKKN